MNPKKKTLREVVAAKEKCQRDLKISATREVDQEARTIEVAFASEEPYERWWGVEIIDLSTPDAMDLTRLNDSAAVLVDHDWRDQVGVIEKAWVDDDRVGRALLRFGKSDRASEIFNDVIDGIRTKISFGYFITHYEEVEDEEQEVYRVRTEPFEISFVAVPADPTVGVGRSAEPDQPPADEGSEEEAEPEEKGVSQTVQVTETPKEENAMDPKDLEKAGKDAAAAERQRAATLAKLGKDFDCADLAQKAIEEEKSIQDFQNEILANVAKKQAEKPPVTQLDLSAKEVQSYSVMRAVRAMVTGDWKGAEFERECSILIAEKLDREARGVFIPHEIQQRAMATAAGTGLTDNSDIVPTLTTNYIDALRDKTLAVRLGAMLLPGLVGDVDIPRLDSGATFYWLDEDDDVTDSDGVTSTVPLSAHTVAGSVPVTRRLMKQSSPAVDGMMMNDLALGSALAIDNAVFSGTGASGQPTGILAATGVNTNSVTTAGQPTWAELVGFETEVNADNALEGSLAYVMTPAVAGHCKTTSKDSGSGRFLLDGGEANGYQALTKSSLAANTIIFGDFSQIVIGMWGVLDVVVDTATKAAAGGIVLRAFQDLDVGIRQPKAFCKNA